MVQYYDDDYYQKVSHIYSLSVFVSLGCLVLLIVGLVSFCVDKRNSRQVMTALEVSFVVQLTYFSLLGVGKKNPLLRNLAAGLKLSSGYDIMMSQHGSNIHSELLSIDIESVSISSNVNISLVIVVMCVMVGGVFLLLGKFVSRKNQ